MKFRKIAKVVSIFLGCICGILSFSQAQVGQADMEAFPQEICVGTTLAVNGQLFRCPVSIEVLDVYSSDGDEVDFYGTVTPSETTVYTVRYVRELRDTLTKSATVIVYQMPYLEVSGTEPGMYCPGTEISWRADSTAHTEGAIRWSLSTGGMTHEGDSYSFSLNESCSLVVRASNSHCPVNEQVFYFDMVPRLAFYSTEIYFDVPAYSTCSACGFMLPDWRDLVDRAADGEIESATITWQDGTTGERILQPGMNYFTVAIQFVLSKKNECDSISTVTVKEVEIAVWAENCEPEWDYLDNQRVRPCDWTPVFLRSRVDTSYLTGYSGASFSIDPAWPGLEVKDSSEVFTLYPQNTLGWAERWQIRASDCGADMFFKTKYAVDYTLRCPYSKEMSEITLRTEAEGSLIWDTNRLVCWYQYCDRMPADLTIYSAQTGMHIDTVFFLGFPVDSLIVSGANEGYIGYRTVWTVRDSINRNREFYEKQTLQVALTREAEECSFVDTVSVTLSLGNAHPCFPYFSYKRDNYGHSYACVGSMNRVDYSAPLPYQTIDSVRIIHSDFIIDTTYRYESRDHVSYTFRPYFPNSLQLQRKEGDIRFVGYYHDTATGKHYRDTLYQKIEVKTCPPEVFSTFDADCHTGCFSCPGAEFLVGVKMFNPSTDWSKSKIEWHGRPEGKLQQQIFDTSGYCYDTVAYHSLWQNTYDLYRESDFRLSITYNEGDSIRYIDSVPLAISRFRVDPACFPRFELHRDSCCGGDDIYWYVYEDYSKYYLEEALWDTVSGEVFPIGSGSEDYIYSYYPQDIRPRLAYSTVIRAPGLYPYTVRYRVNDTILQYKDTLKIAMIDDPRIFTVDTLYICAGSDVDLSLYIDSTVVAELKGISGPEDLKLKNVTVDRIFPLTARMKYTCDKGDEVADQLYILAEQDVYLDYEKDMREVCPLDSIRLRVSTNGRVDWIKYRWQAGLGWQAPDTLYSGVRNATYYDRVDADTVRYTVVASTVCTTPPFLEGSFKAIRLPMPDIRISNTVSCYPDSLAPEVFVSGYPIVESTEQWYLNGEPVDERRFPASSDSLRLTCEIQGENGCWNRTSVNLYSHMPPRVGLVGQDPSRAGVCLYPNRETVLQAEGADLYDWTGIGVQDISDRSRYRLQTDRDTCVYVTGTDSVTGCRTSDTVAIRLFAPVLVDVQDTLCRGGCLSIPFYGDEMSSYAWYFRTEEAGRDSLYRPGITESDTGLYTVVSGRYFCADTQYYRLHLYPVPAGVLEGNERLCQYDTLQLTYSHNAEELYGDHCSFRWMTPAGFHSDILKGDTLALTVGNCQLSDSGWYGIRMTYGVCELVDSMFVRINPIPYPLSVSDTFFCRGRDVLLNAENPAFPGGFYRWDDGTEGAFLRVDKPGVYRVALTFEGCTGQTSVQVEERPLPFTGLPSDTSVCRGEECVFHVPEGYDSYAWYSGLSGLEIGDGPQQGFSDASFLWVEVEHNGCRVSDTVFVERIFCGRVYFASAFTPNGDGHNDIFAPVTAAENQDLFYELTVFDMNGTMVFRSTDVNQGWDGMYQGKPSPAGMYVYRCKAKVRQTGRDVSSGGNVVLAR